MVLVGGLMPGGPMVTRVLGCFPGAGPGGIVLLVRGSVLLVMGMLMLFPLRHASSSLLFGPAQSARE